MEPFKLNNFFIISHMEELIHLEDYLPFSLVQFDKQKERDEFLRSKNLLDTLQKMDELINQKCKYYPDSVKAYNSILIEWIDFHPEFEGIITPESFDEYQKMKNNNDFLNFINFLRVVELPSEKKVWVPPTKENMYLKDDSSIQLPNFKEIDEIFDKYGVSLLSCYLSYLV